MSFWVVDGRLGLDSVLNGLTWFYSILPRPTRTFKAIMALGETPRFFSSQLPMKAAWKVLVQCWSLKYLRSPAQVVLVVVVVVAAVAVLLLLLLLLKPVSGKKPQGSASIPKRKNNPVTRICPPALGRSPAAKRHQRPLYGTPITFLRKNNNQDAPLTNPSQPPNTKNTPKMPANKRQCLKKLTTPH